MPLFGHRCLATDPKYRPSPVFSLYQTDVIYYGANTPNWVANDFEGHRTVDPYPPPTRVPFWADLTDGLEPESL